jgi:hypothetical protein
MGTREAPSHFAVQFGCRSASNKALWQSRLSDPGRSLDARSMQAFAWFSRFELLLGTTVSNLAADELCINITTTFYLTRPPMQL